MARISKLSQFSSAVAAHGNILHEPPEAKEAGDRFINWSPQTNAPDARFLLDPADRLLRNVKPR
jgi:hypothetical protein